MDEAQRVRKFQMDQQSLKIWRPTLRMVGSISTETVFSYEGINSRFYNVTRPDFVTHVNPRPLPKNLGKPLSSRASINKGAHIWNMYAFYTHTIDISYSDWLDCRSPCRYHHQMPSYTAVGGAPTQFGGSIFHNPITSSEQLHIRK